MTRDGEVSCVETDFKIYSRQVIRRLLSLKLKIDDDDDDDDDRADSIMRRQICKVHNR